MGPTPGTTKKSVSLYGHVAEWGSVEEKSIRGSIWERGFRLNPLTGSLWREGQLTRHQTPRAWAGGEGFTCEGVRYRGGGFWTGLAEGARRSRRRMRPQGGRGLTPPSQTALSLEDREAWPRLAPPIKLLPVLSFPSLFKGLRLKGEGEGTAGPGPSTAGQREPSGVCKGRRRAQRAGVHGPSSRRAEDASPRSWGTGGRLRLCPLRATTCTAVTSQRGHRRCRSAHRIYGKRPPPPGTRHAACTELPRRLWPAGQLRDHGHSSP